MSSEDHSNGYESVSADFIRARCVNRIGAQTIGDWARTLPAGASVLDVACGCGVPVAETLLAHGLRVYGVDGSPTMIAAFRERFPRTPLQCADITADHPDFFGLEFDAVVAWGILFLLSPDAQLRLISRIARGLRIGGRLLFTAPAQSVEWTDVLTGRKSISLGRSAYQAALASADLEIDGETEDEGGNHYYFATRSPRPAA